PLPAEARDDGVGFLTRLTGWLVRQVVRYPAPYFLAGLIAVVLCGLAYIQLEPHYRLADQVPDQEHALAATSRLDQKLTGANPVHVMIEMKEGQSLYDPATFDVIARAHKVLEEVAGLGNVWSVDSLRRWLAEAGDDRSETVKTYV